MWQRANGGDSGSRALPRPLGLTAELHLAAAHDGKAPRVQCSDDEFASLLPSALIHKPGAAGRPRPADPGPRSQDAARVGGRQVASRDPRLSHSRFCGIPPLACGPAHSFLTNGV